MRCWACKETKPADEFTKDRTRKNGHRPLCVECNRAKVKAWQAANPDKVRANYARRQETGRQSEAARRFYRNHPEVLVTSSARLRALNNETLQTAERAGCEWTGAEMELIMRDDLTVKQMAVMLGRSYWAVLNRRQLIRRGDPRSMVLTDGTEL